jgi:outer membrane protein insertion porin family
MALVTLMLVMMGWRQTAMAETEPKVEPQRSVDIVFRGNAALSKTILRKAALAELTAFEEQGQRRSDADDAAFQMELAYRKDGYAFAAVDYQIDQDEKKAVLTFDIEEGPRVILKQIEIAGNTEFDTRSLLPFFEGERTGLFGKGELLFLRSDVQAALSKIQDLYISRGFREVVIAGPHISFSDDRTAATVAIEIAEGIRYVIQDIIYQGDVIAEAQASLSESRQTLIGQAYFHRRRLILESRLVEIYGNLGYPQATVEVFEQQGPEPGSIVLIAEIAQGPRVLISDIFIRGNEKTSEKFVRNRLLLKPGDPFNLELQTKSFSNLYRTGLFSKVDLHLEQRPGTDQWPLLVEVVEAPAKELYFEPGWGSYEKLRLKAGFREKNLFGSGRIFGLDATAAVKAQSLVASLSDPWFLNTDISADLPLYFSHREEPSFTRTDLGSSILFSKKLTDHLNASTGYGFRRTDTSNLDVEELAEETPSDYNYASIEIQTNYDTRNDIFFPTTGQKWFISGEYAGTVLGSQLTLTRFKGGGSIFIPLFRDTVLGMRYGTGLIIPGEDDFLVPIGERFFNGGENTVRSFSQSELGPKDASGNPTGGLAFNVFNIELRQRLIGNLTGTVFFDCGNVSPNRSPSERDEPLYDSQSDILSDTFKQFFSDFRYGIGTGLQYLLPVGPARIDFAINPDQDRQRDEEAYAIHFSVGMAF